MNSARKLLLALAGLAFSAFALPALADGVGYGPCAGLPSWGALQSMLAASVGLSGNNGLGFNMWGTIVANDGTVCAVAFSGSNYTSQWLGSRVISAQKANTANDFSLSNGAPPGGSLFPTGLALSTANLYSAVQPGGSLYGLQHSNPVDPEIAYQGNAAAYGTAYDPLVGQRVGGVNVFGGGLALYKSGGIKVGAVGVSGDTSCTDHFVAWHVRNKLGFDHLGTLGVVPGADAAHPDNIIYDITPTPNGGLLDPNGTLSKSANGFGHPTCVNPTAAPNTLPNVSNP
ncbi:MAG: heme-binding protein [Alphaproteobacteria bacterium]|nr:heme-binding protein [Alphaproteobacteria bacterium]